MLLLWPMPSTPYKKRKTKHEPSTRVLRARTTASSTSRTPLDCRTRKTGSLNPPCSTAHSRSTNSRVSIGWSTCTSKVSTEFWPTKWVSEKQSSPSQLWHILRNVTISGDLSLSLRQHRRCTTGNRKSPGSSRISMCCHTGVQQRIERSCVSSGIASTSPTTETRPSMSLSHPTSWLCRTHNTSRRCVGST